MITSSSLRRRTILAAAMMANLSGIPRVVVAQGQAAFFQVDGVALRGYDPVSYFDGEPRLGSGSIAHNHQGTSWRFATAENRDRFVADPARFLPQYGGYCALGMAHGGAVPTDPLAYTVYRGKLYLNSSKLVRMTWSYARDWMIERAAPNWRAWLERQAVAVAGGTQPDRRPSPPDRDPNLAAGGLDVLSFFEPGGAQLGDSTITHTWKGKTWRFRSVRNRTRFERSPEAFAPQFDGLSPLILAHGEQVPGDPRFFTVLDGKLYFEVGEGPRETWRRNADPLLERAREQWKALKGGS